MRLPRWVWIVIGCVTYGVAAPAGALPSFARKYGMACSECHAVYPKLTPLGRRFKEDGYRLPDDESSWRELLRSFPGSFRGSFSSSFTTEETRLYPADVPGPAIGTFKPIAAGSASSWISFWVDLPVEIAADKIEAVRRGHYWVRANDVLRRLRSQLLHVKGGQFELDLPFTRSRTYNLFGYAPYQLTGSYQESIAAPHRGIELSGSLGRGFRYSLAVADTVAAPPLEMKSYVATFSSAFDADLYFRVCKTVETDNRVGSFLYLADDTRSRHMKRKPGFSPPLESSLLLDDDVELLGADADWHLGNQRFNLYGLFVLSRQKRATNGFRLEKGHALGGFVQLDTRLLKSLTLVARYSWTRTKVEMGEPPIEELSRNRAYDRRGLVLGAQWWLIQRLKLAFEYRVLGHRLIGPRETLAVDLIL
jgi:hypothetical protein